MIKRIICVSLLLVNLSGCSSPNSEFEKQVNQSWEEAFQKAQIDPCSLEASSICNATDQDPRFATWAAANPLSACPEKNYSGSSSECSVYDEDGKEIKISCDESLGYNLDGN